MTRIRLLAVSICACLLAGAVQSGPIKTWTDEDGGVHFGDAPPPRSQAQSFQAPDTLSSPSGGGLRPGEREMLERLEAEEQEFLRARERAGRELQRRRVTDQADCRLYRSLAEDRAHRLRQGYGRRADRRRDERLHAHYERLAGQYCR